MRLETYYDEAKTERCSQMNIETRVINRMLTHTVETGKKPRGIYLGQDEAEALSEAINKTCEDFREAKLLLEFHGVPVFSVKIKNHLVII